MDWSEIIVPRRGLSQNSKQNGSVDPDETAHYEPRLISIYTISKNNVFVRRVEKVKSNQTV